MRFVEIAALLLFDNIFKLPFFTTFKGVAVVQWVGMGLLIERSRVRLPADCGGVRKSIRPQMLLCDTSTQVRRPALILKMKNQVTSRFFTEYHRVSRL